MSSRGSRGPSLEQEIGSLAGLGRPDLVARWRALYRADPPKGISRPLLVRAIAYAMQARRYGGLNPAKARRLQKIAAGRADGGNTAIVTRPKLALGSRLVREWNGATHIVEVVEGGFLWEGRRHRSLSAIARAITGARWSGPRFFGITSGGGP